LQRTENALHDKRSKSPPCPAKCGRDKGGAPLEKIFRIFEMGL